MARRAVNWWTVVSLTLAGLALVRLGEVFIKRELIARSLMISDQIAARTRTYQDSLNQLNALRVDLAAAKAQGKVAPDETYLILKKGTAQGRIMMGSKVVYEFRFRVRGGVPVQVKGQLAELPEGALSVQAKEDHPAWYKPDWMYEHAGLPVPKDSAQRRIEDAFGRYAILLGGGVAVHGPADKLVPQDAIDHVYAEVNVKDLKAIYSAVNEGSRVLIQH